MNSSDTFTLIDNKTNKKYDFDVITGSKGLRAVDFSKLYAKTGAVSYDPGFGSTAGVKSKISYIDGEAGKLTYYGYSCEELANKYKFTDICKLLIEGELPKNDNESLEFDLELRHRSFLRDNILNIYSAFPQNAHIMANLSSAISALCVVYNEHLEMNENKEYEIMAKRIIAKISTLAAFGYRHYIGVPFVHPDVSKDYVRNFLHMIRAYPDGRYKHTISGEEQIQDIEVEALNAIFILHADHGQNASTSTLRSVASTLAHPYAAISAGVNALWGKSHGGANEAVMMQLDQINDIKNVDKYIARAKDKNDAFRLMGFGHRVYKNYDPRARILKKIKDKLSKNGIKMDNRLNDLAEKIEEIALSDDYFIEKKLYPNVDFYSGIVLSALKIPKAMFTPIFAIGRTPGWCAQYIEHIKDPSLRITRPRQLYMGK